MRRIAVDPRPFSQRLVQSQGLVYSGSQDPDDPTAIYWPDDRYYSFTSAEVELLEEAGKDVFDMCCEAADYLVEHPDVITNKMAIPAFALTQIVKSWNREPPWGSVYGRFDACFGGLDHPDPRLRTPKFYEFNADTPTSLVEAASIQWLWLEQTGHGNDQFNSITEKLIEAYRRNLALIEKELGHRPKVFFASADDEPSGEDVMNLTVMMDTAKLAREDIYTKMISVEQIALGEDGRFYVKRDISESGGLLDDDDSDVIFVEEPDGRKAIADHIDVIFKLYPWEHMVEQHYGEPCFKDMEKTGWRNEAGRYIGGTVWMEPPYKMLWSNKAIFAVLWELFKDDPRAKWLLPTYFEEEAPKSLTKFAMKPIFSREGADILLQDEDKVIQDEETGEYGKEGYIVQELALPPEFKDEQDVPYYPVLGLWFVDGEPAGMGIREDKTPITTNGSTFVPHSISDGPVNYERKPVPDLVEIEAAIHLSRYEEEYKGVVKHIGDLHGGSGSDAHRAGSVPITVKPSSVSNLEQ